jgi:hypothetical protein
VLPEKGAHGRNVSPDTSVGRLFSAWLKKNFPALANKHVEYTHIFRGGRRINGVRAYPNSMLGMFRDYVINVWMRDHAPKYFKRVDPPAVPFLEKVLAALPAPADYPALSAPDRAISIENGLTHQRPNQVLPWTKRDSPAAGGGEAAKTEDYPNRI